MIKNKINNNIITIIPTLNVKKEPITPTYNNVKKKNTKKQNRKR